MKRLLTFFLAFLLVLNLPTSILAAEETSGKAGDNATWEVVENTLIFRGTGELYSYNPRLEELAPWRSQLSGVTSIVYEKGITRIGDNNILYAHALTEVSLPDTVVSIGNSNFSGCDKLEKIVLPAVLISIGDSVLSGNEKLTSVQIGSKVESIGKKFLFETPLYESSKQADGSIWFSGYLLDAHEVTGTLSVKEGTLLIANEACMGNGNLTELLLPDSLLHIGEYAFQKCRALKSVTFPNRLTSIGYWAFAQCESFDSILLPDSVKKIADSAFYGCYRAETLRISAGLTELTSAFSNTGVKHLVIPEGVKKIDEAAFLQCLKLESVVFSDSVEETDWNSFTQCPLLQKVHFGKNFKTLGRWTFLENPALREITIHEDNPFFTVMDGNLYSKDKTTMYLYAKGKPDATFIVPLSVTTLAADVFSHAYNLTEIILHNRITSIGEHCAYSAKNLARITIPDSVTEIGRSAFELCNRLLTIELGTGIKNIHQQAFGGYGLYGRKIYYAGSPEQWDLVTVGAMNERFSKDNITFNTPAVNPIVYVTLNGEYIDFSKYGQNPVIENGRTLVPLRSVFEALGASVEWEDATQTVTSKRGDITVKLTINSPTINVNGEVKNLDVAPKLLNERTMVPLRAVVEAFGCQIGWDDALNTASITV